MPLVSLKIEFDTDTGVVNYALLTDFVMCQQLLVSALGESLKRELATRATNPGILKQRPGLHLTKG